MPTLPNAYQARITPLIDTAREAVERGETPVTMAFVGNRRNAPPEPTRTDSESWMKTLSTAPD